MYTSVGAYLYYCSISSLTALSEYHSNIPQKSEYRFTTATVSVDTIIFVHIFTIFIFQFVYTNYATAILSVDTVEFDQPNKNNHLNMFVLSVATATVSADTIFFWEYIYHFH